MCARPACRPRIPSVIITVASFKGGVGKTTSAYHLAAYLQNRGETVLVDGDLNRSALGWAQRGGPRMGVRVVDERQAVKAAKAAEHLVLDTPARPSREDLEALAAGCDLLIVPSTPDALSLDALLLMAKELRELGADRFRVLLTMCPPRPSRDAEEARALLEEAGLPVFRGQIRRAVAFQKAALSGVPVYEVNDPRAAACWADYRQVGEEILP